MRLAVAPATAVLLLAASSPPAAAAEVVIHEVGGAGGCLTARNASPLVTIGDCYVAPNGSKTWIRSDARVTSYVTKLNGLCMVATGTYEPPDLGPCRQNPIGKLWIRKPAKGGINLESKALPGWCLSRASGGDGPEGDLNMYPCKGGVTVWK